MIECDVCHRGFEASRGGALIFGPPNSDCSNHPVGNDFEQESVTKHHVCREHHVCRLCRRRTVYRRATCVAGRWVGGEWVHVDTPDGHCPAATREQAA